MEQSASKSINDLNPKSLACILSFLPVADRLRLQRVSKCWQEASKISLSQLTKLECFYHLSRDVSSSYCRECGCMSLQQLCQVLPSCGKSLKYFRYLGAEDEMEMNDENMTADIRFFKLLNLTCPNLQTLNIDQMKLTSDGLRFAAKYYNNFTELRISLQFVREDLNNALMQLFASTKRLSALSVECIVTDLPTCLEKAPAETLESLNLDLRSSERSLTILANIIKSCYKLCKLRIECGSMGRSLDPIFNIIRENGRQDNFKTLQIIGAQHNLDNASILPIFTKLESLALDIGRNLSNSVLKSIGNECQSLTSLTIIGSDCITDEGLVNFSNLKHLKLTAVENVKGTFFTNMPNLETVEMTFCRNIVRDGLKTLFESAKKLRLLDLWNESANKDCVDVAPRNRGNKIPLKICLVAYNSNDARTYKQDYLTVKQT